MPFTDDELRSMKPLVTDHASLAGYLTMGYTLQEDRPYYRLFSPDGAWYAFVDRAMAEAHPHHAINFVPDSDIGML